jgi:hypothetical protein
VFNEHLSNDRGKRIDGLAQGNEILVQAADIRSKNAKFGPDPDKLLDDGGVVAERLGANHRDVGFEFSNVCLHQPRLACDLFADPANCVFEIVHSLRKLSHFFVLVGSEKSARLLRWGRLPRIRAG